MNVYFFASSSLSSRSRISRRCRRHSCRPIQTAAFRRESVPLSQGGGSRADLCRCLLSGCRPVLLKRSFESFLKIGKSGTAVAVTHYRTHSNLSFRLVSAFDRASANSLCHLSLFSFRLRRKPRRCNGRRVRRTYSVVLSACSSSGVIRAELTAWLSPSHARFERYSALLLPTRALLLL